MRDRSNWTVWQFTETGEVEGIPKYVDIDVLNINHGLKNIHMK